MHGRGVILIYDLRQLTMTQLERLYHRVWDRMTRYSGYQPFGHDRVTMLMVHPEEMAILDSIKLEGLRRLHS